MDTNPGAPDPLEGDPPPGRPEPVSREWEADDEGPFFPWLPPEDRLWRHPSEGAAAARRGPAGENTEPPGPRWTGIRSKAALRSTWAVALVAGLVGASAATGVGLATGLWPHDTTVVKSLPPSKSSVSLADVGPAPTNWTAIDDSVADSVVTISVQGAAGPQLGSGIVLLSSAGQAAYVVGDRSLFARDQAAGYLGPIEVTFLDGHALRAKLVGSDPLSGLAVLEIAGAGSAVPANLGTVADLREADQVIAVGSRATPSVATGVATGSVSGEDRTVALADGTDLDGLVAVAMPALGATASGGPILDQFGQVVGVTLSLDPVSNADQQFTFAVPIDEVSRVATEMIDGAPLTHPWLGVTNVWDLPSVMAHQLGLVGGVQAGTVAPGSPAGLAGVRPSDVITSLNGKPVSSTGALVAQVSSCVPGTVVPMSYVHDGRSVQTTIRVGEERSYE